VKIHLYFTPNEFTEEDLKDRVAVVIDVLRTTTTMTLALRNGCKEIIPVADIESAVRLSSNLSREFTLLCGERYGRIIEGFDLGNSPAEYAEGVVRNKTLIFSTTNGTALLVKSKAAMMTALASFVNLDAVCGWLRGLGGDIAILCAGKQGRFALEDAVCGGMILQRLRQGGSKASYGNDGALAAGALVQKHARDLRRLLAQSQGGRDLVAIGLESDLDLCAQLNSTPVVPTYRQGVVTLGHAS